MDLRLRNVALRQLPVEAHNDHGRPLSMKAIPRPSVGERRTKVVA